MAKFGSVDEILDFAIEKEEEAARFYSRMAAGMSKPWMSDVFHGFAEQELRHKTKLEQVKAGGELKPAEGKITDLKIADYLVDVEVSDSQKLTYAEALTLAMKREKASFKLYMDLADVTDEQRLKDAFVALAQEEAKHKLYMEIEYDEKVLKEN